MTCCVGKARIYYREPLNYWLTYQLSDGSFGSVTAPEPLTTECVNVPPEYIEGEGYKIRYLDTSGRIRTSSITWYPPFGVIGAVWRNSYDPYWLQFTHANGTSYLRCYSNGQPGLCGTWYEFRPVNPSLPIPSSSLEFKVIGTETGTVYREIGGLEECPTVISNTCLMGEENYYDTLLPDQSPGGLVESSCFYLIPSESDPNCVSLILETKYKEIPGKGLPLPPKTRSQGYFCGLPGCPPEVRIECCPDGECDPPKCPPDTDCQLDCGDFICCYKDGRVIKTIYK